MVTVVTKNVTWKRSLYKEARFGHHVKADFQSVEFSERAEIPLFERENVALKLNG